jgi:hypothetical protein
MKLKKNKVSRVLFSFPRFFLLMGISMLILFAGCAGDDVNEDIGTITPPAVECEDGTDCNPDAAVQGICDDISGTWEITEVIDSTLCGIPQYSRILTIPTTQNGCEVTIHSFSGIKTDTLKNNSITWTGSYPENGGTVTGTYNLTVDGDTLEGSSTWTMTDGVLTCSGTSQLTGTRSDFTIGPGCEDVSGSWHLTEDVNPSLCGDAPYTQEIILPVTQNGCELKVNPLVGLFDGTVNGNGIKYSGSFPDSGGTGETTVNLTITDNELTGSASWSWTDGLGTFTCPGINQYTGEKK